MTAFLNGHCGGVGVRNGRVVDHCNDHDVDIQSEHVDVDKIDKRRCCHSVSHRYPAASALLLHQSKLLYE